MEEKPGRSRAPTGGRLLSQRQDFVMHPTASLDFGSDMSNSRKEGCLMDQQAIVREA